MVAHTTEADKFSSDFPLAFQNVCALVKFTTDYRCKSIKLTAKGGENLTAEELRIAFDENGKPTLSVVSGTSSSVTLTGKDGEYIQAGTYYIAVLPGTLASGFDITFANVYDEKTYTKTGSKAATLTRSKILNLGTISIKSEMIHMDGTGTQADPYLIHDFDQLKEMRDFVNYSTGGADCFKQVEDIDGGGETFEAIGTYTHPFHGSYDGGGHTLSNIKLSFTRGDYDYYYYQPYEHVSALFGIVKDATIKSLVVDRIATADNDEYKPYWSFTSLLVGMAVGSEGSSTNLSDIVINDTQTASFPSMGQSAQSCRIYYGGLVAYSACNLNVTNCTNYFSLAYSNSQSLTTTSFGSLVGIVVGGQKDDGWLDYNSIVNIDKCRNYGNFSISGSGYSKYVFFGGILGVAYEHAADYDVITKISNCVNFGSFDASGYRSDYEYIGGIMGDMDSDGYGSNTPCIWNCINNGSIKGSSYAGGIVGICYDDDTQLLLCANTGAITANNPRSMIGYKNNGTLNGCYNYYKSVTSMKEGLETTGIDYGGNKCESTTISACIEYMNGKISNDPGLRTILCPWKLPEGSTTMMDLDF